MVFNGDYENMAFILMWLSDKKAQKWITYFLQVNIMFRVY